MYCVNTVVNAGPPLGLHDGIFAQWCKERMLIPDPTHQYFLPVCSRAGVVLQVLSALGWWLCHHHLPHLRGSLLPDAHHGSHRGRLLARQVQVSFTSCKSFTLQPSYVNLYTCLTLRPPSPVQDYCLPVHRLHGGTGCLGSECHPWHHRYEQGRHPGQHDPAHVSWPHTERRDAKTADTKTSSDIVSPPCFALRVLSMLGLALIAVGTGGIKPCVSAFGGDQFQDHQVGCHSSKHANRLVLILRELLNM